MRIEATPLLLLLIASPCSADKIRVPADYPAIQQALAAAQNSDCIEVAPGTCVENINFPGKAVTLTSTDGPEVTCIDGNQQGSTVLFENLEGPDSEPCGFTITNGSGTRDPVYDTWYGGGFCCRVDTSPTLEYNMVRDNRLADDGVR